MRITKIEKALEDDLKRQNLDTFKKWLSIQIAEQEHKLRFASGGDLQILQGSLRTLDDIADILKD